MAEEDAQSTLADHLEQLALDADDVLKMLTVHHDGGGDINPEALPKAERLQTSMRGVIDALKKHDHLVMKADDVWSMLTAKHSDHESGFS